MTEKFTRKNLEALIKNPEIVLTVIDGQKGYYLKSKGPAFSFTSRDIPGAKPFKTWRDVAYSLGIFEPTDPMDW